MCQCLLGFSLAIVNVLYLLFSAALVVLGALLHWGQSSIRDHIIPSIVNLVVKDRSATVSMANLSEIMSQYAGVFGNIGLVVFIIGCVLLVISLCGTCGVFLHNRVLLHIYIALTGLIWIALVAIIIVLLTRSRTIREGGQAEYVQFLRTRYVFSSGMASSSQSGGNPSSVVDLIQIKFQCCGSASSADFTANPTYNRGYGIIPFSCCVMRRDTFTPADEHCPSQPTAGNSYMGVGCHDKLWTVIELHLAYITYGLIGVAIFLLLLIIAAGVLQFLYKESNSMLV